MPHPGESHEGRVAPPHDGDAFGRGLPALRGRLQGRPGARIEEQLGAATGAERLALLKELVRLDAVYRRAAGQAVSPAEYLRRFPELDAVWLEREMTPATLTNAQAPGLGRF